MQVVEVLKATAAEAERPRLGAGDLIATILGLGAGAVFLATVGAWDWALVASYRTATLVLAAIGIGMCIAGGTRMTTPVRMGPFFKTAAFFGFVALGLTIAGVATGARADFVALGVTMLVLWVVTTTGHALHRF